MMKKLFIISLLILCIGLLFTSCAEEKAYSDLEIKLSRDLSKTIMPTLNIDVVKYDISCVNQSTNENLPITTSRSSVLLEHMSLGTYDISVTGYTEDDTPIIQGQTTFQFTQSARIARVVLNKLVVTVNLRL